MKTEQHSYTFHVQDSNRVSPNLGIFFKCSELFFTSIMRFMQRSESKSTTNRVAALVHVLMGMFVVVASSAILLATILFSRVPPCTVPVLNSTVVCGEDLVDCMNRTLILIREMIDLFDQEQSGWKTAGVGGWEETSGTTLPLYDIFDVVNISNTTFFIEGGGSTPSTDQSTSGIAQSTIGPAQTSTFAQAVQPTQPPRTSPGTTGTTGTTGTPGSSDTDRSILDALQDVASSALYRSASTSCREAIRGSKRGKYVYLRSDLKSTVRAVQCSAVTQCGDGAWTSVYKLEHERSVSQCPEGMMETSEGCSIHAKPRGKCGHWTVDIPTGNRYSRLCAVYASKSEGTSDMRTYLTIITRDAKFAGGMVIGWPHRHLLNSSCRCTDAVKVDIFDSITEYTENYGTLVGNLNIRCSAGSDGPCTQFKSDHFMQDLKLDARYPLRISLCSTTGQRVCANVRRGKDCPTSSSYVFTMKQLDLYIQ